VLTTSPFCPEDPAHVDGLAALFAASDCRCYCRYWHFPGDKNAWLERCYVDAGRNEAELREAAARGSDEAAGVVALHDGKLVGWAKVAPSAAVKKFYEQRYYRGLPVLQGRPSPGVHAVGCLLVHPEHRGQRVAHALVREAVALARRQGATALEAFPRRTEGRVSDEEHWMGPEGAFLEAGFQAVEPSPPYPVYRIDLR
jgi:GNAT superfamily N-acetyltransferase